MMAHSIFGWSYPPGCSGPPEPDHPPCEVCGLDPNWCECPVCPVCETQGDPKCYEQHGLDTSLKPERSEPETDPVPDDYPAFDADQLFR